MRFFILVLVCVVFLNIIYDDYAFGQNYTTLRLASDDAYVISDLNDPQDKQGFITTNTGELNFLKIGYDWSNENQKIINVGYLKFDLTSIQSPDIIKAELVMQPHIAKINGESISIDLIHVSDDDWNESEINYINKPTYLTQSDSSISISELDVWYSWDITSLANKNKGEELSVALVIKNILENTEENVLFNSIQVLERAPHLRIIYTPMVIEENTKDSKLIFIILGISIATISTIVFIAKSNIILKTQKSDKRLENHERSSS